MTYYTKPGSVTVWATTPHGEMEVARVGPATRPMTLRRADARLFAAAPDLIRALQDMLGLFDQGTNVAGTAERFAQYEAATNAARAAIIKALEGQQ